MLSKALGKSLVYPSFFITDTNSVWMDAWHLLVHVHMVFGNVSNRCHSLSYIDPSRRVGGVCLACYDADNKVCGARELVDVLVFVLVVYIYIYINQKCS